MTRRITGPLDRDRGTEGRVTRLYIVRHGETDWNREGRVQGHTDTPLNATGRSQARALRQQLVSVTFHAAYASDLSRAYETATIIIGEGAISVIPCRDLRERHCGDWEGRILDEIAQTDPIGLEAWRNRQADAGPPGGENESLLQDRVLATLDGIVAAHAGQTVLVATHGGPVRAILGGWLAHDGNQPVRNCEAFIIEAEEGQRRLVTRFGPNLDWG